MMRTLELNNLERLLGMSALPPITKEHQQRMLKNIRKFEPQNELEKIRKKIVVSSLETIDTV